MKVFASITEVPHNTKSTVNLQRCGGRRRSAIAGQAEDGAMGICWRGAAIAGQAEDGAMGICWRGAAIAGQAEDGAMGICWRGCRREG
ncbi:hypothetical protein BaRGS_00025807 [Batillaria attramentaria]|uniref:Uncharacterized protein n=1 Tax=Batillaria attramentaria TaxID=370345 RepID=A0ABD0K714_9CAEN